MGTKSFEALAARQGDAGKRRKIYIKETLGWEQRGRMEGRVLINRVDRV